MGSETWAHWGRGRGGRMFPEGGLCQKVNGKSSLSEKNFFTLLRTKNVIQSQKGLQCSQNLIDNNVVIQMGLKKKTLMFMLLRLIICLSFTVSWNKSKTHWKQLLPSASRLNIKDFIHLHSAVLINCPYTGVLQPRCIHSSKGLKKGNFNANKSRLFSPS